jgi:hypothetical protein
MSIFWLFFRKNFCYGIDPLFRPPLKTLYKGGYGRGDPPHPYYHSYLPLTYWLSIPSPLPNNIVPRRVHPQEFADQYIIPKVNVDNFICPQVINKQMWITLFVYNDNSLIFVF